MWSVVVLIVAVIGAIAGILWLLSFLARTESRDQPLVARSPGTQRILDRAARSMASLQAEVIVGFAVILLLVGTLVYGSCERVRDL